MSEGFWVAAPWIGVCLVFVLLGYADHRTKRRRLEMLHEERMLALEKGVPLPELPEFAPPARPVPLKVEHPNAGLVIGIIFLCAGVGGVIALVLVPDPELHRYWSTPLPLGMVGLGLILYHYLPKKKIY